MTLEEARYHLYFRQGLSLLPTKADAMRAMVAVQTQYAQSLNHALAARSQTPEPEYETAGLVPDGDLVKSWTLRGTVHTHTREDFRLVLSAVGPRGYARFRSYIAPSMGMSEDEYDRLEEEVLRALEAGPLSRKELHERVPDLRRCPWIGWGGDMKGLAYKGQVSFVGVGAEQRFARLHGFEALPNALEELARRYFASFGPATPVDFRVWTGVSAVQSKAAFEAIRDELEPVRIEGESFDRFVYGRAEQREPRPAVLLAKFDPLLMAHRDRSHLFLPEHLPKVYRIAGQVEAVFLLKGEAVGTWRLARKATGIVVSLEPWRTLRKVEVKALERESVRLAKSLGVKNADLSLVV